MAKTVTIQMQSLLKEVDKEVKEAAEDAIDESSKETAKLLREISPKRKGNYAKGWTVKKEDKLTRIVHNKTHYRLTHLLEKGHVLRRGGRKIGDAAAFVHIAPAEDIARDLLASKIAAKLEG